MPPKQQQLEKEKEKVPSNIKNEEQEGKPRSRSFAFCIFILSLILPIVLPTSAILFEIHYPEFHSPIRRSGRPAVSNGPRTISDFCNFDRLHCCNSSVPVLFPRTVEEIQNIVKTENEKLKKINTAYAGIGESAPTPLIRVVGAGHSMSPIVCTSPDVEYPSRDKILMSLDKLYYPAEDGASEAETKSESALNAKLIKVLKTFEPDHAGIRPSRKVRAHVWASGGMRLKQFNEKLWNLGYGLFNTGMIDEQSLAGLISTPVHGTGIMNAPINKFVVRIDVVLANGTLAILTKESHPQVFKHARMHLGLFGVVVGVAFEVRERFYIRRTEELLNEAAAIDAVVLNHPVIDARIAEATTSSSSSHLKTRSQAWWFQNDQALIQDMSEELSVEQVESSEQLQSKIPKSWFVTAEKYVTDLLYLFVTTLTVYVPVTSPLALKLAILNHGISKDFIMKSYEAFTHPGVNYHTVRYSETELFVPVENAGKAWDAYKKFLEDHSSTSSVCNINTISPVRTTAPDGIPLSPSFGGNKIVFSFTLVYRNSWKHCSRVFQKSLEPFGARPHWGKWFSPMIKNRVDVEELYGKEVVEEFSKAVKSVDPLGLFRPMMFENMFF